MLLTGHTGFKGAWMSLWLEALGSRVTGVSLPPPTDPSLFEALQPWSALDSHLCDIRDRQALQEIIDNAEPEIVVHLAAQSLVRDSYRDPITTFETNIMGTANLLESLRGRSHVEVVLVVTSDKVYDNRDTQHAFTEDDPLGGDDPYSASKAAAELVTAGMVRSFFSEGLPRVATVRGGNVIGGGDWGRDRLVPDLWRAAATGEPVAIRYPAAVRPWQHVLDLLSGYLRFLDTLLSPDSRAAPSSLNFGPDPEEQYSVEEIAAMVAARLGSPDCWHTGPISTLPEKQMLTVDSTLARTALGWKSRLSVEEAVDWTCEWYRAFGAREDMRAVSLEQISRYCGLT